MISRYVSYHYLESLDDVRILPFCKITIDDVSILFQEQVDQLALHSNNIVGIRELSCVEYL